MQKQQQPPPQPRRERRQNQNPRSQIGAVVSTRLTKPGVSNLMKIRLSWVTGFTYVGNGVSGSANAVYFLTQDSVWITRGFAANSSGLTPIASADTNLGQTYAADIEKHFQRKVIHRMWIHVDSLQPSTANNMMAILSISRGPGGMAYSIPITAATAAISANTVGNVASMTGAFTVDSWESKTCEISQFIAGGSGSRQNEFEISGSPGANAIPNIYNTSATPPVIDGDGLIPACFAVAGNSTTATLAGTKVHQITIEQEVSLLDYIGGMSISNATD